MKSNGSGNGPEVQRSPELPERDELNYVHDLLSMIAEDLKLVFALEIEDDDLTIILASRNVLCWILGHENTSFPDGVRDLEESMRELGQDTLKNH